MEAAPEPEDRPAAPDDTKVPAQGETPERDAPEPETDPASETAPGTDPQQES